MPSQEMRSLDTIYKGGFFKNRDKMMWRVPIFCDAIIAELQPHSIIDIGCAIGDFVQGFIERGLVALGMEGSPNAIDFMKTHSYFIQDIREPFPFSFGMTFDLCMSLEVAEHIEPEYADTYIANLCKVSNRVLISAAPPGQKGHYHVNCQPIRYWDEKFNALNYYRDPEKADAITKHWEAYKTKAGIKAYYKNLHYYEHKKG